MLARAEKAEAEVERLKAHLALWEELADQWSKDKVAYWWQRSGGRESGAIPPEGESGTVSPPTGRTASTANPAAHNPKAKNWVECAGCIENELSKSPRKEGEA